MASTREYWTARYTEVRAYRSHEEQVRREAADRDKAALQRVDDAGGSRFDPNSL